MNSGSKVISFRLPVDLAEGFEKFCEEAAVTSGEILRKLVDDTVYPGAELAAPAEKQLYGVEATAQIVEIVNRQIKSQLDEQLGSMVDAHLELVQIDRGLTEAEKKHYDSSLAELDSRLVDLKVGINKLVQVVNDNVGVCNEEFVKVARLFQFLESHTHDDHGAVAVSDKKLLDAEVKLADKRSGKMELPKIIHGKTDKPGYIYYDYLNISMRE